MKTIKFLSLLFFAAAAMCLTSCGKDPTVENYQPKKPNTEKHNWPEEMGDTFGNDTSGKGEGNHSKGSSAGSQGEGNRSGSQNNSSGGEGNHPGNNGSFSDQMGDTFEKGNSTCNGESWSDAMGDTFGGNVDGSFSDSMGDTFGK